MIRAADGAVPPRLAQRPQSPICFLGFIFVSTILFSLLRRSAGPLKADVIMLMGFVFSGEEVKVDDEEDEARFRRSLQTNR